LLDRVYATGERYIAQQTPVSLIRASDGIPDNRYLDFADEPIFDEPNQESGIFVNGFDAIETHQAQEKSKEPNETWEQQVNEPTRKADRRDPPVYYRRARRAPTWRSPPMPR
jgi:hypothetical protein